MSRAAVLQSLVVDESLRQYQTSAINTVQNMASTFTNIAHALQKQKVESTQFEQTLQKQINALIMTINEQASVIEDLKATQDSWSERFGLLSKGDPDKNKYSIAARISRIEQYLSLAEDDAHTQNYAQLAGYGTAAAQNGYGLAGSGAGVVGSAAALMGNAAGPVSSGSPTPMGYGVQGAATPAVGADGSPVVDHADAGYAAGYAEEQPESAGGQVPLVLPAISRGNSQLPQHISSAAGAQGMGQQGPGAAAAAAGSQATYSSAAPPSMGSPAGGVAVSGAAPARTTGSAPAGGAYGGAAAVTASGSALGSGGARGVVLSSSEAQALGAGGQAQLQAMPGGTIVLSEIGRAHV